MRIVSTLIRPAAALALVLSLWTPCLIPAARGQTFDTVLNTNLFQPTSVSVSPDNQYVIADTANHRIVRFNADSRAFSVVAGPDTGPFEAGAVDGQRIDARFRNPQGVLCLGDRIYVADTGNHAIREIDAAGNVRTIAGDIQLAHEVDDFGGLPANWGFADGTGAQARFNGPCGLTSDGEGRLIIADSGNRAVRLLDLQTGTVTTLVSAGLSTPVSVAAGPNGILFISDPGAHSIKIWRPGDARAALVAGGGTALARGFRNSAIAANALFSAPGGIYYREAADELIVADSGNSVLRSVLGVSGPAPKVETFANTGAAGFQTPIAVTRDIYGVYLVCDSTRNALASVITVKFPRIEKPRVGYISIIIDSSTGLPVATLAPVTDTTFDNLVRIVVSGDSTAQHLFTYTASLSGSEAPSLPGPDSATALNFPEPMSPAPPDEVLNNLALNATLPPRHNFRVKVYSAPKGVDERIPSLLTEAVFRFKCATPLLDSQSLPGRLLFRCSTTNAVIHYTMDGSDPVKGSANVLSVRSGESIPLVLGNETLQIKARAYRDNDFLPSDIARAEFSPENFVPNRISLGFEDGEGSTLMRAAPGQRYFAPVTLSLMPKAQAYGLQFNVTVEPKSAPASPDYQLGFHSTLIERFPETNRVIPPATFVLAGTNYVTNFVTDIETNFTYRVVTTNYAAAPVTNFVTFANRLAETVPVITTTFVTNLGTIFPVAVTNYITNTFQLVSEESTTNVVIDTQAEYFYSYTTPGSTNTVHTSSILPDFAPVVVTNFLSNLGQTFPVTTTHFISNNFHLVSASITTNETVTVSTSFVYRASTQTNYLTMDRVLPEYEPLVITNTVSNLGVDYQLASTNLMLSNWFELVSVVMTNHVINRTNHTYFYSVAAIPVTNQLVWPTRLPDNSLMVMTNTLEGLGIPVQITVTNTVLNSRDFVSEVPDRGQIAYLYQFVNFTTPRDITSPQPLTLSQRVDLYTTGYVTNLNTTYAIEIRNEIPNPVTFITSPGFTNPTVETNAIVEVRTNALYRVIHPLAPGYLVLSTNLPDVAPVVTLTTVTNLGQSYTVATTNYATNVFELVSTQMSTNRQVAVSTNAVYEIRNPSVTHYFELASKLPDFVEEVTTSFITNLGQLFPVRSTNILHNLFTLLSTNTTSSTNSTVTSSFRYAVVTPGAGPELPVSVSTNLVTLDRLLPAVVPIVTLTGFATNLLETFPIYTTNYTSNAFQLVSETYLTNTLEISLTNVAGVFADLVLTNHHQNWLAVGWVERFGRTNLFDTRRQHLLSFSQPHNTMFLGANGEAVLGAVSFQVPAAAANGNTYTVRVGRPSATADGVSQDMYIQAPEENDPNSPVKAVRTLTITNRVSYIAGDVSDFRWFNGGEFGDGNILNNDITDLQQGIVYGFNIPPLESDFLDAMDTCCYTADGRDLSSIQFASQPVSIDDIAFGDGSRFAPLGRRPNAILEINDLFVAFRRALDPGLVWYERFWSNGTLHARSIPNTFRGAAPSLSRQSVSASSLPAGPSIQTTQQPALTVFAGAATGLPGKVVAVPIRARVEGGFPLRTLMFNARVETAGGQIVPGSSLEFALSDGLGLPAIVLNDEPGRPGAVWLDTSIPGILGEQVVGRLLFTIPADAAPSALYYVKLDRVSGSPNGISLFPVRSGNGLIAMANRPAPVWNDGIPDAWRVQYFGSAADLRSAADADADGDGLSNYEEYKLGTHPLDASESLRIHAAANGHGVKLRFRTASGKKYRIEGSANLEPGSWTVVLSDVAGTGGDLELPGPGGARAFYYRVRLQE